MAAGGSASSASDFLGLPFLLLLDAERERDRERDLDSDVDLEPTLVPERGLEQERDQDESLCLDLGGDWDLEPELSGEWDLEREVEEDEEDWLEGDESAERFVLWLGRGVGESPFLSFCTKDDGCSRGTSVFTLIRFDSSAFRAISGTECSDSL